VKRPRAGPDGASSEVVRFELPHNGWCASCGRHVARGVRFNAQKRAAGSYLSTTIWSFTMRCGGGAAACDAEFVVRTDPQRADYVFVAGIRRQAGADGEGGEEAGGREAREGASGGEDGGAAPLTARERERARARARSEPLWRAEREADDRRRAAREGARLAALGEESERRNGAGRLDVMGAARAALRGAQGEERAQRLEGAARGLGDLALLPLEDSDAVAARAAVRAHEIAEGARRLALMDAAPASPPFPSSSSAQLVVPPAQRGAILASSVLPAPAHMKRRKEAAPPPATVPSPLAQVPPASSQQLSVSAFVRSGLAQAASQAAQLAARVEVARRGPGMGRPRLALPAPPPARSGPVSAAEARQQRDRLGFGADL